ncbi:hypothetical protein R1flu_015204 [Riccia fluitans]|uniref:Uncharacterized protein n=1 Tax=Riccia fluitans TaxID=41844 RepID=A0ABD1YIM7_9MARC
MIRIRIGPNGPWGRPRTTANMDATWTDGQMLEDETEQDGHEWRLGRTEQTNREAEMLSRPETQKHEATRTSR